MSAVATHTCIIDEDIQTALVGLHLIEGILDRLVTGKIELHSFDSVARLWAFLLEGFNSRLGLLQRPAAHQDVVWLAGLQKCLDCLVSNTAVSALNAIREGGNPSISLVLTSYKSDDSRCHCVFFLQLSWLELCLVVV